MLLKEIGIRFNGNEVCVESDTYELDDCSIFERILRLTSRSEVLGIEVAEESQNLPFPYLLPKFHKNPVKFRTIVASMNTVTSPVSKKLAVALNLMLSRLKNYCVTIKICTKVNGFWVINSNLPILETLSKLSRQKKLKSVETYDFTTLYTSINHENLLSALEYVFDIGFISSRHRHMVVYSKSAKWTNADYSVGSILNIQKLMEWTSFN